MHCGGMYLQCGLKSLHPMEEEAFRFGRSSFYWMSLLLQRILQMAILLIDDWKGHFATARDALSYNSMRSFSMGAFSHEGLQLAAKKALYRIIAQWPGSVLSLA